MAEALTDMTDAAAPRRASIDARAPRGILQALLAFATASAMLMGHGLSAGGRRRLTASSALFVLAAMTITLILVMDQPVTGGIRVSQAPLDRVAAELIGRTPRSP